MHTLLFDIDGTLIRSGGAGFRAMRIALLQMFGIDDFPSLEFRGRKIGKPRLVDARPNRRPSDPQRGEIALKLAVQLRLSEVANPKETCNGVLSPLDT